MINQDTPKFVRLLLMFGFADYEDYIDCLEQRTDDPELTKNIIYSSSKYLPDIQALSDSLTDEDSIKFMESPYYQHRKAQYKAMEDLTAAKKRIEELEKENAILLEKANRKNRKSL